MSVIHPKSKSHFMQITQGTFSITVSYLSIAFVQTINIHFMSRIETTEGVLGFSLSRLMLFIIISSLGIAFNQTIIILMPKEMFTLARTLLLNFAQYINLLTCLIMGIFYNQVLDFFLLFLKDTNPKVQENAQKYMPYMLCLAFIMNQFDCIKCFLISHQIYKPFFYIQIISCIIHFGNCFICVNYFDMQGEGLCMLAILTEILNFVMLLIYIIFISDNGIKMFQPFYIIPKMFVQKHEFKCYFSTCLPVILQTFANVIAFDISTIFAARIGVVQGNAQIIFANISSLFFKFSQSLTQTLISFSGKAIALSNFIDLKLYLKAGHLLFIPLYLCLFAPLYIYQDKWIIIYTEEQQIQSIIYVVLPCFFVAVFSDGFQNYHGGILKSFGKVKTVSYVTILINYTIGLPLTIFLVFYLNLQVLGIWMSFGLQKLILAIFFKIQIKKEVNKAEAYQLHL